ncbi:Yip1 domain protein [uncultured archaeon]|nr:Yip1 domain protein [uncultured archaeon]
MVDIPTDMWIPALTKPAETLAKANKKKASLVDAAIVMTLAGAVCGAVVGLMAGPMGLIGGAIGGAIATLLMSLLGNGVVWVMAKILGGKGEFSQQYCLYSLFGAPIAIAGVLNIVPVLGGILNGLLSLYMLYPLTLSIKEVHKLDTVKAVLAWLIPGIVLAIVAFIVGAAIAAMLVMYGLTQAGSFG